MNSMLEIIAEIVTRFTEGFCLYFLFSTFEKKKSKPGVKLCITTVIIWVLASKMLSLAVYSDDVYSPEKELISIFSRVMLICIIGFFLYIINKNVLVFIALIFISFLYISIHISQGLALIFIYGFDRAAMEIAAMNSPELVKAYIIVINLARDTLTFLLLIISTRIIIKNCRHDLNRRNSKEIILYMLPIIMGGFSSILLHFIISFINYRGHVEYDNYYNDYYVYFAVTIVFTAIWIAMLFSFKLQQKIIGLQEEQLQKSIYENQISQMQSSITEMEAFYDGLSSIKHDMKNQIEVLKIMIKEKNCDDNDVKEYFNDMHNTLDKLEHKIHTGNAVSDAVINAKFKLAEKEIPGIKLNADNFILTDNVKIKPYDIGIILNNGLDNAIEACMRMSGTDDGNPGGNTDNLVYITLKSFRKKNMLFIEIKNSYRGNIIFEENDLPKSTKNDSRLHGIGLKNIRACASQYMGDIACTAKDGVFILSVMLKA